MRYRPSPQDSWRRADGSVLESMQSCVRSTPISRTAAVKPRDVLQWNHANDARTDDSDACRSKTDPQRPITNYTTGQVRAAYIPAAKLTLCDAMEADHTVWCVTLWKTVICLDSVLLRIYSALYVSVKGLCSLQKTNMNCSTIIRNNGEDSLN